MVGDCFLGGKSGISTVKNGTELKPRIVLRGPAVFLKPDVFFGKLTDLSKLEKKQSVLIANELNQHLRTEIIDRLGTVSDAMSKALRTATASLDCQKLKDCDLSTVVKSVLETVKENKELVDEASKVEGRLDQKQLETPSRKISDLLHLDVPLRDNPIFSVEIRKAKTLEYARLANLSDKATTKLADKNLDLDDADETVLTNLVVEKILNTKQKEDLQIIIDLGRLAGDNLAFIETLKAEGLKSVVDFISWSKADWQKLINDEKIPLPPGETTETYAENIVFNIERTYPSHALLSQLTDPKHAAQLSSLDSVNGLLQNNNKLIDGEKPASIDWRGASPAKRQGMQKDLQELAVLTNIYKRLDLMSTINDKNLELVQKKNVIASRIKLLDTFRRNNPELDLQTVSFFDIKDEKLNWRGIPTSERVRVKKQFMAYQRMLRLAEPDDSMTLLSKGYDNALAIADRTEFQFVKTSGLDPGKSRMIYARALEYSMHVAHYFEAIRDVVRGELRHVALASPNPKLVNALKDIDGFADLFDPQNFCECEECVSVLSPAAYFVDLMYFIEQNISSSAFSTTDHPLHLKNRRSDLWKLKLNCENTHTKIPYLTIVNEVLEKHLKDYLESTRVQGDIFEELSNASENISFALPFNLPLEELRLYLTHFGISLHQIYRLLNQQEEKIWRARIGLSKEEFDVITIADKAGVKLRFGDHSSSGPFEVQEFIRFAGITRQQLSDLQVLTFNPDLNIIVRTRDSPDELQNFPEELENLTDVNLDFIHRLIRLWKKTSWSIPELDLVLTALRDAGLAAIDLDSGTVLCLAQLIDIQEKLKLKVEELCAMVHNMPASYPVPPVREADKKLFERIFDPKKLFGEDSAIDTVEFRKVADPKAPLLLGGLGISETELLLLFELLKNEIPVTANDCYILDLSAISLLYRHTKLAKALGLSIEDFIQALHLNYSGNPVVTTLQQIHQLIEFRDWLKSSKFNVPKLRFVLKGEESVEMQYAVDLMSVGTIVQEVQKCQEGDRLKMLRELSLPKFFNITPKNFEKILRWVNNEINSAGIQMTLNASFTEDAPDNPDDLKPLLSLMQEIEKALQMFSNLEFMEETIANLTDKPSLVGIADQKHLVIDDLKGLTYYKKLIALDDEAEPIVQSILNNYSANNSFFDTKSLANLWKTDQKLIDSLVNSLSFSNIPISAVEYLWRCLVICQTLGINGSSLQGLAKDDKFAELISARDIALGAFSSKYEDEKIRSEKLEPYEEEINVKKRDALCDYILASQKDLKFKDLHDIYAYFLLDVEMSRCFRTSRLVAAISSLQLYVHRCLVNLEQSDPANQNIEFLKVEVKPEATEQWEWRKNYRVWEANRKIFLYPENYLEPDLRDNKTPIFRELEDELLQQKITKESAEAAYRKYVSQFAELARLRIAGSYYDEVSRTYYFFGRTQQDPPQYYYRRWIDSKIWTPWEKIELAIDSDRVAAAIYLGRLYIFWVKIKTKENTTVAGGTSTTTYENSKELGFSFLNEQGKWVQTQKLDLGVVSYAKNNIVFPFVRNNQIYVVLYEPGPGGPTALNMVLRVYRIDLFRNIADLAYAPCSECAHVNGYNLIPANSHLLLISTSPLINGEGSNRLMAYLNPLEMTEAATELGAASPTIAVTGEFVTSDFDPYEFQPELHIVSHKPGDFIFKLGDQQYLIQNAAPPSSVDIGVYTQRVYPSWKDSLYANIVAIAKVTESSARTTTMSFEASSSPSPIISFSRHMYAGASQRVSAYPDNLQDSTYKRYTYRISTSLADELGEKLFTEGLEGFLSLDTQKKTERSIGISFTEPYELLGPSDDSDHIDFRGAYGEYYRELFLHVPFLIAGHLNANQKFREAKWWYERIFDPAKPSEDTKPTDHNSNWRYIEFVDLTIQKMKDILTDKAALRLYEEDPFNPHAIARLRLNAYQKAIVMKYIDNLLDWGDYLFAQDTVESINEATILYILAADILGKRPAKLGKCKTAEEEHLMYESIGPHIDEESEFLITLENLAQAETQNSTSAGDNSNTSGNSRIPIRVKTEFSAKMKLGPKHRIAHYIDSAKTRARYVDAAKICEGAKLLNAYPAYSIARQSVIVRQSPLVFCVPPNEDLLEYWDRVEDRLHKIRYCLNISGVRRELALFQPSISPMLLVRARAAGLSLEDILAMISAPLPPYRFTHLIEKAKQFTQTVQSFGSALLGALEKKDAEELTLLRSVHERNILQMTKEIKKQQLREAQCNFQAMVESKVNVQNRIEYYDSLIKGGLTGWEITQQVSKHIGTSFKTLEGISRILAAIFYLIPEVGSPFAMKFGGPQIGDSTREWADWMATMASIADSVSASASLEASFQRREQEWEQQLLLAQQELKQVEKQQLAAEVRTLIAEKDLEIHEKNMEQADELHEFYRNKFTNLGLYNYLSTTLNRLYREAYNVAYDLAKMAERTYQFERDDDTVFIASDNWQFDRAGLLAGDRLLLQLQRIEKAYMEQHKRDYEITQSFSLALWKPSALVKLRQEGSCDFKIPEIMFDLLYPGQYKRLIKSVRVTIPCVAGPYANISAKLTLTGSKVRKDPTTDEDELTAIENQRINTTSIATSNALNDGGSFELSFNDPRYLPFEGAGAISDWTLELPSKIRSLDYDTISDVIIHISYTAKDDGLLRTNVENQIVDTLSEFASSDGLFLLMSLKHEFSNALYRLLHPSGATQASEFELEGKHFPYFLDDKDLTLSSTKVYLKPKGKEPMDTTGLALKINNANVGGWSTIGENLKEGNVSLSGNPIRKWMIDAGTEGLDREELDDILILLKYKTA